MMEAGRRDVTVIQILIDMEVQFTEVLNDTNEDEEIETVINYFDEQQAELLKSLV